MQGQCPWLPFSVRNGVGNEVKDFIYAARSCLQGALKLPSPQLVVANHQCDQDTRVRFHLVGMRPASLPFPSWVVSVTTHMPPKALKGAGFGVSGKLNIPP
jgi:hypothetical protein